MKDKDILKYKNGKYLKGILDYDDEHNCVHEFLFEEGDWFCALGSPNNLSVNVFQLGVNELDQETYYLIVGGMTSDKHLPKTVYLENLVRCHAAHDKIIGFLIQFVNAKLEDING